MDGSDYPPGPRDAHGRFAAGNPGRRLGSRNLVSQRMARAVLADFEANQEDLLARARRWYLPHYLTMAAKLLPRPSEERGLGLEGLGRDEALAVIAAVRAAADAYEAGLGPIEALEAALLGEGGEP